MNHLIGGIICCMDAYTSAKTCHAKYIKWQILKVASEAWLNGERVGVGVRSPKFKSLWPNAKKKKKSKKYSQTELSCTIPMSCLFDKTWLHDRKLEMSMLPNKYPIGKESAWFACTRWIYLKTWYMVNFWGNAARCVIYSQKVWGLVPFFSTFWQNSSLSKFGWFVELKV